MRSRLIDREITIRKSEMSELERELEISRQHVREDGDRDRERE